MQYILARQQKYAGKDVVFLYVSFDRSSELMSRLLKDRSIYGTQLIDSKGFGSDAALKYNIGGIPRYLVVDKDGLLISADAPRPSMHPDDLLGRLLSKHSH
jgi:hypothetical protein